MEEGLLIFVGLLVGVINAVAGSGSAIVLPVLIFLGYPPQIANATNRLGILGQTLVSSLVFMRNKSLKASMFIKVVPGVIGALLGAFLVQQLSNDFLLGFIKAVLVVVFLGGIGFLFLKKNADAKANVQGGVLGVLFFFFGVYGGFIQVGLGLVIVGLLHFVFKMDLLKVNVLKNALVLTYTIFVVLYFGGMGLIDYKAGSLLAIGQMIGGYLGAKALYVERFSKWIRVLFFIMLSFCVGMLFVEV